MSIAVKLSPQHPFLQRDVIMTLANGLAESLKTMSSLEPHFEKPFVARNWRTTSEVSVYLTLDSAPYKGRLFFHYQKSAAKEILEKMTGSEVAPDSDEILDGMGELSNIIFGSVKTKLNTLGFTLLMTVPKPCWSKELPISISDSICMVIPFTVGGVICYVEITIL